MDREQAIEKGQKIVASGKVAVIVNADDLVNARHLGDAMLDYLTRCPATLTMASDERALTDKSAAVVILVYSGNWSPQPSVLPFDPVSEKRS